MKTFLRPTHLVPKLQITVRVFKRFMKRSPTHLICEMERAMKIKHRTSQDGS
jgi:hypothetical protein